MKHLALACLLLLASPVLAPSPASSATPSHDGLQKQLEAAGMVLIPAGAFMMGSPKEETGHRSDEEPQHVVQVRSFALAKYDVTRGDYAQFAKATGHSGGWCQEFNGDIFVKSRTRNWQNPGFDQTDRDPVVCVSYDDALAYIRWYSGKTGREYRLPTEAEWEYAARAGTTTEYYWGNSIGSGHANCDRCGSHWDHSQTSPVGSFEPNPWGLYDMAGNVDQWTQDCWNENYIGAPTNGRARTHGDCRVRALRGGTWNADPDILRAARRYSLDAPNSFSFIGFRLARTLP